MESKHDITRRWMSSGDPMRAGSIRNDCFAPRAAIQRAFAIPQRTIIPATQISDFNPVQTFG
jgi:hypothetical protein